jgi:hypothetical protein
MVLNVCTSTHLYGQRRFKKHRSLCTQEVYGYLTVCVLFFLLCIPMVVAVEFTIEMLSD